MLAIPTRNAIRDVLVRQQVQLDGSASSDTNDDTLILPGRYFQHPTAQRPRYPTSLPLAPNSR